MLLLNPCLSRAWMAQSLQQVSVSCVKPPPKLMSQAQTMHWSHLSTRAVGHAQEDTNQVFTRLARQAVEFLNLLKGKHPQVLKR